MHAFFKRLSWDRIASYLLWDCLAIASWEASKSVYYRLSGLWSVAKNF